MAPGQRPTEEHRSHLNAVFQGEFEQGQIVHSIPTVPPFESPQVEIQQISEATVTLSGRIEAELERAPCGQRRMALLQQCLHLFWRIYRISPPEFQLAHRVSIADRIYGDFVRLQSGQRYGPQPTTRKSSFQDGPHRALTIAATATTIPPTPSTITVGVTTNAISQAIVTTTTVFSGPIMTSMEATISPVRSIANVHNIPREIRTNHFNPNGSNANQSNQSRVSSPTTVRMGNPDTTPVLNQSTFLATGGYGNPELSRQFDGHSGPQYTGQGNAPGYSESDRFTSERIQLEMLRTLQRMNESPPSRNSPRIDHSKELPKKGILFSNAKDGHPIDIYFKMIALHQQQTNVSEEESMLNIHHTLTGEPSPRENHDTRYRENASSRVSKALHIEFRREETHGRRLQWTDIFEIHRFD